jgi:hypothetical protein
MVWQAHIKSNGEWIAAKILQGIFGAPIESIAEVTIAHVVSPVAENIRGIPAVLNILSAVLYP